MEEFRRIVLTPEFGEWLCTVAATKDSQLIADLCVKVLEPEGRALPLIEFLIKKEIKSTSQPGTLFRSNSLASKMMSAWSKLEDGQLYLQQTLIEPIKAIVAGNFGSLEINPINLVDPSMLERNVAQLQQIIQRVFDAIVASADKYPLRFRIACSYLKQYCGEKFPESALICVGGFVVLRYFCPAIVAPDNTGILEESPSLDTRRNLVLISKTIQNLANCVTFRESFMMPLNSFLDSNQGRMKGYLDSISQITTPGQVPPPAQVPVEERESSLVALAQLCNSYLTNPHLDKYPLSDPAQKKTTTDEIKALVPKVATITLISEKEQRKRDKEVQKTVEKVEKSATRSSSSTKLEKSRIRIFRTTPSSDCLLLKKKDRELYKKAIVSRIIEAAQAGADELEELLDANRKYINSPATHDMTALHYACKAGQLKSVKLLLRYEASCYLTDDRMWTCLHIAASENHEEIIWELIQQEHIDLNATNEDDNTPLHYLSRHPSLPRFLPIFKKKHGHINAQNANGETPLHLAVMKGNQEVIEQLLLHGADPTKTNAKSESPMVWAARLNNPAITALLQKALDEASKPVDPSQVCKKFLETVSEGNVPLMKEMLRNDPNLSQATDPNGNTALHIAVSSNHLGMTKALLLSQHVSTQKNTSGMTPLMLALSSGEKVDCAMSILISSHPIDVTTKLEDGSTLLHLVAKHPFANCEHICFALVQRGIDLHAVDNNGDTPCHIAVRSGNTKVLDALLDLGASRNKTNNNHESVYSIMSACKRNEDEEIKEKITSVVAIISSTTDKSSLTMWLRVLSVHKIMEKSNLFPDSALKIKGLFTTVTEASRNSADTFGSLSDSDRHRLIDVKAVCVTRLTTGLFVQYRDNPSSVPTRERQRLAKILLEIVPSMTGSS